MARIEDVIKDFMSNHDPTFQSEIESGIHLAEQLLFHDAIRSIEYPDGVEGAEAWYEYVTGVVGKTVQQSYNKKQEFVAAFNLYFNTTRHERNR